MIISLLGPTATGKTEIACFIKQKYNFEIVSIDSALIFKEMDIGTAKPTSEDLRKFPHHLINLIEPNEKSDVFHFYKKTLNKIEELQRQNKNILLVGGTMLYFNTLFKGISNLPMADQNIREILLKQDKDILFQELEQVDLITSKKINKNDLTRIIRALEVYKLTGVPLSKHFDMNKNKSINSLKIAFMPEDRSLLHKNIEERLKRMFQNNFIEEVEYLNKKYWNFKDYQATKIVGYAQILQYLKGCISRKEAFDKSLFATRQLAKRQLTWIRNNEYNYKIDPYIEREYKINQIMEEINEKNT